MKLFCYLSMVLHSNYLLIVVENFHFHVPSWKIVFYAQDVLCDLFPFSFVLFVGIHSSEEENSNFGSIFGTQVLHFS